MSQHDWRPNFTRRRLLETSAVLSGGALVGSAAASQDDQTADDQDPVEGSIGCGDVVAGELTPEDPTGFRGDLVHYDEHEFEGEEGEFVSVSMTAVPGQDGGDGSDGEGGEDGGGEEGEGGADGEDDQQDGDGGSDGEEGGQEGGGGGSDGTDDQSDDGELSPLEAAARGSSEESEVGGTASAARQDQVSGDPYLYVLDPQGRIVAEDDDGGGDLNAHATIPGLPESGTYTIVATSFGDEEYFSYEVAVECGSPFDPEPIACGDTITGTLTPEDPTGFLSDFHAHDAYEFEGSEGSFLSISMDGLDAPVTEDCQVTTGADPMLVLLGPDFQPVAWDDDSGGDLNALVNARLAEDGTYTLIATSWAPELYFSYELSVDCREPLDPEPIECGQTVEGELTPDDEFGIRTDFGQHYHDSYVFEGSADDWLTVTMGYRSRDGHDDFEEFPLGDSYLYLFNPDGELIAEDDDRAGDLGAMIQHRLSMDGEYTIVATSFETDEFFPYELTVGCSDVEPPITDPRPIGCDETVTGELRPGDRTGFRSYDHFHDVYEFEGTAGQGISVSMSSSEGNSFLYLLDPDGEVVALDHDAQFGFDALIERELEADGTYTVVATSYWPAEFFEYDLTVVCWEP